ncbi:MAG: translation elongation factor 4 [Candidatus Moranbacteria bacterium]|nr:translation elongation factor 4 [Candidatus Moranbacteria bacterium]
MNQKNVRNFAIIAHIDHGKSTLSDRFLELTKTVEKRDMKAQLLDQMDLERERGITIKLQPVRMNYELDGQKYVLNLIDTPGHVDFGYEVSRSLAAVEGVVLLVDATKGVQAQTLSNLYLAIEQGLEIIPVVNKVDLPNADAPKVKKEIIHVLGCKEEEIFEVSGKTGLGVDKLLEEIVRTIPHPRGDAEKPLRALIFDSKYDTYKGVVAYVRVLDGRVKRDDEVTMMAGMADSDVVEVGYFKPDMQKFDLLTAGDIGYLATGFKSVEFCRVGDTITNTLMYEKDKRAKTNLITPLPGYKKVTPMVYASFYPTEGDDYNFMRDALDKLKLNDAAFEFEPESSQALGRGFRCGFLGMLHLEIIQSRLEREFEISPTITTPSVVYEIEVKNKPGRTKIYSATEMPDASVLDKIYEPYAKLDVISPANYLGSIMEVMRNTRGQYVNTEYIDSERIILTFDCPLTDVITNLHDDLKSASSGYASLNYEIRDYRPNDLVKMDILVAGEKYEAFSRIVPREKAVSEGKAIVEKLKNSVPKQNFLIILQAAIGGKIIARENIQPYRKDVTGYLYGGDVTRKNKLLDKQKRGKKKMKSLGKVNIPSDAFLAVLKK